MSELDKESFDAANAVKYPLRRRTPTASTVFLNSPRGRRVARPTYLPGGELVFEEDGETILNMARPFNLNPVEGNAQQWLDLVAHVIPDPKVREVVLDWLAYQIQLMADKRALTLATHGLLTGNALAIATEGLIQVDASVAVTAAQHCHTAGQVRLVLQGMLPVADSEHRLTSAPVTLTQLPVAPPVQIPVIQTTGGGTYSTRWFDEEPQLLDVRFKGFGVLTLQSSTRWRYRESLQLPPSIDFYYAEVELVIDGRAEWSHYDWQAEIDADDEDVLMLVAAYLQTGSSPIRWNEPY